MEYKQVIIIVLRINAQVIKGNLFAVIVNNRSTGIPSPAAINADVVPLAEEHSDDEIEIDLENIITGLSGTGALLKCTLGPTALITSPS